MDFLKKAKSQVKSAANQAQGYAQQLQGQYLPQQHQQQYQSAYPGGAPYQQGYGQQQHVQYQPGQASTPQHGTGQYAAPSDPPHPHQQHQQHQYHQQPAYSPYPPQSGYQPSHSPPQAGPSKQPQHQGSQQSYGYPAHSGYPPPPAQAPSQQPPQNYGSQQGYQSPHTQPQPNQTFDMRGVAQALPSGQGYTPTPPPPQATGAAPQRDLAPGPAVQHHYPSPPPTAPQATPAPPQPEQPRPAAAGNAPSSAPLQQSRPCPGHGTGSTDEVGSLEIYTFYVFHDHVIKQESGQFEADQFAICGACYTHAISSHPQLSACFRHREKTLAGGANGPGQTVEGLPCKFALPRVRQTFYNECVPQNSIGPMIRFATLNATLPACPKFDVQQPMEYYTSRTLGNLAVCKTCFEQYFRSTPFEYEMYVHQQGAVTGWGCDVGFKGFIFKSLVAELAQPRPDFRRFAARTQHRLEINCPGDNPLWPMDQPVAPWTYEPRDGGSGVFCEACFLDKIYGTRVEHCFNKRLQVDAEFQGNLTCDLASLPSKFAMDVADKMGDGEVWRRCMSRRGNLPKCEGVRGVDEEDLTPESEPWYSHKEYPKIEICPICTCSTVELYGALPMFQPITRPLRPGIIRMCFLSAPKDLDANDSDPRNFENTLVWRGIILRRWLHQGYSTQNGFIGFKHAVKMIAGWEPPCASGLRSFKPINGRKWYGNAYYISGDEMKLSVIMCEECWADYVKGTPVESVVGNDRTETLYQTLPNGCTCSLVTQRCKDKLNEGCQSGNLQPFLEWWGKRQEIGVRRKEIIDRCQQQIPRVQAYKAQLDMQGAMMATNLMQQLTANTNATIARIGGSIAEASATDYGQRYGNSAVGYGYLTSSGAAAAQASLDAQNLRPGVSLADFTSSGDLMQDTYQLIALQTAVDKEWAEVV